MWIKNPNPRVNRKDTMLTLSVYAFSVVCFKILFAGVSFSFGEDFSFTFGSIDSAVVAALLAPTLGSYVARKYVDYKKEDKSDEKKEEEIES